MTGIEIDGATLAYFVALLTVCLIIILVLQKFVGRLKRILTVVIYGVFVSLIIFGAIIARDASAHYGIEDHAFNKCLEKYERLNAVKRCFDSCPTIPSLYTRCFRAQRLTQPPGRKSAIPDTTPKEVNRRH